MPVIHCYGEDALTLWIIREHLSGFLGVLEDLSPVAESKVFYRPSFGRRGSNKDATVSEQWRSAFGEFDAIVATRGGTYLIETKWTASSEAPRLTRPRPLQLSPTQVRRHAIMRNYIDAWRAVQPSTWDEFIHLSDIRDRLARFSASVPRAGTTLARNIGMVLILTAECGPVSDVVLFMRSEGGPPPGEVEPSHFALVGVDSRNTDSLGHLPLFGPVGSLAPKMWLASKGRPHDRPEDLTTPSCASRASAP
jgi:hypothetical protein